jgi:hypothetical protein
MEDDMEEIKNAKLYINGQKCATVFTEVKQIHVRDLKPPFVIENCTEDVKNKVMNALGKKWLSGETPEKFGKNLDGYYLYFEDGKGCHWTSRSQGRVFLPGSPCYDASDIIFDGPEIKHQPDKGWDYYPFQKMMCQCQPETMRITKCDVGHSITPTPKRHKHIKIKFTR